MWKKHMAYYEDGTLCIYYLKEAATASSLHLSGRNERFRHLHTGTTIPSSSPPAASGRPAGSAPAPMVKVKDEYLFFYTGHASAETYEYMEKIMLARGKDLTHFEKVEDWAITPPDELGQKRDFRDPQAYYDAESDTITLTVTASQGGVARILKYTLSGDLSSVTYDGIIFTNSEGNFWNLECSDTFRLGDKHYLTYSAGMTPSGMLCPIRPTALWRGPAADGKLPSMQPEHVEGPAGRLHGGLGAAQRESPSSTSEVSGWSGQPGSAEAGSEGKRHDLVLGARGGCDEKVYCAGALWRWNRTAFRCRLVHAMATPKRLLPMKASC